MATALQKLQKAHEELREKCPFTEIEESIIVKGEVVTAKVGGGEYKAEIDNSYAAPQSELQGLADAVIEKVRQHIEAMDEFLKMVLDEKMPELVLDAITDGEIDLRETFVKVMKEEGKKLEQKVKKAPHPFDRVSDHRKFDCMDGRKLNLNIEIGRSDNELRLGVYSFADALQVFYVWPGIVAWVDDVVKKLKLAAGRER